MGPGPSRFNLGEAEARRTRDGSGAPNVSRGGRGRDNHGQKHCGKRKNTHLRSGHLAAPVGGHSLDFGTAPVSQPLTKGPPDEKNLKAGAPSPCRERLFFSEEKNQKTFNSGARGGIPAMAGELQTAEK